MNKIKLIFLLLFTTLTSELFPGVNLKNGNFYIGYTDIEHKARVEFEVSRTYNSRSADEGLFGTGWGSEWDEYVTYSPEGYLTLHFNGSGKTLLFQPTNRSTDKQKLIALLIKTGVENGDISDNPAAKAQIRQKLENNINDRKAYLTKYLDKGWLKEKYYPEINTVFEATWAGHRKIIYKNDEYRMELENEIRVYNKSGKIIRLEQKKLMVWKLVYKDNILIGAESGNGVYYSIRLNNKGKILSIQSKKSSAEYNYDSTGNLLVYNKDDGGNIYRYAYDLNTNLIRVNYTDGTSMDMEYHPITQMCTRVKMASGKVSVFAYFYEIKEDGTKNDNHYWTDYYYVSVDGDTDKYKVEYIIKSNSRDEEYEYQNISTDYSKGIENIYQYDQNGYTEYKRRNYLNSGKYNECWFLHDARGNLVEKRSGTEIYRCRYNANNKLEYLIKVDTAASTKFEQYFEYDDKNNLTKITGDTSVIILNYNENGEITKMLNNKNVMNFKYNKMGKPVRIETVGLGYVNVLYYKNGEIKKVESPDGHSVALRITQSFQELLKLSKPEGLDYNF